LRRQGVQTLQRIIFAGSRLGDFPCRLERCQHCQQVNWKIWERAFDEPFECQRSEIPYFRLPKEFRSLSSKRFIYLMVDPWEYLRSIWISWYFQGGKSDSFIFYQEFRRTVDRLGLETDLSIQQFADKLKEWNTTPLYNAQLEAIDPSKRIKKIQNTLKKRFSQVTIDESWAPDDSGTPFGRIEFLRYENLFLPFVKDELYIFHTFCSKSENTKEIFETNKIQYRGLITSLNKQKGKGRIEATTLPEKSCRIVIKSGKKILKRIIVSPDAFQKNSSGGYRARFEFDMKPLIDKWRKKDLNITIVPGKKALRFGKRSNEFLNSLKKDRKRKRS